MNKKLQEILDEIKEAVNDLVFLQDETDLFSETVSGAIFSAEANFAKYRYMLWRIFNSDFPLLYVFMLNPSEATHDKNDRTISGLIKRAYKMGYGGICVINCFAYRSKSPSEMKQDKDPVGPHNDKIISIVLSHEIDLLCAWGTNAHHNNRNKEVQCAISTGKATPFVLRLCGDGTPEHPLYIPQEIGLSKWGLNYPGK